MGGGFDVHMAVVHQVGVHDAGQYAAQQFFDSSEVADILWGHASSQLKVCGAQVGVKTRVVIVEVTIQVIGGEPSVGIGSRGCAFDGFSIENQSVGVQWQGGFNHSV